MNFEKILKKFQTYTRSLNPGKLQFPPVKTMFSNIFDCIPKYETNDLFSTLKQNSK